MKIWTPLLFLFLGSIAEASPRGARFAWPLIRHETASQWQGHRSLFEKRGDNSDRPIFIIAGDSLAIGWASASRLLDRYQEAFHSELPAPNDFFDLLSQRASKEWSWHSGRELNYGVLGRLDPFWRISKREQKESRPHWILISAAYGGATLLQEKLQGSLAPMGTTAGKRGFLDTQLLKILSRLQRRSQVRLLSLSTGGNDVCQEVATEQNEALLEAKLKAISKLYPKQRVQRVIWRLPNIAQLKDEIFKAIEALPEETLQKKQAKERLINYCKSVWLKYCPVAFSDPDNLRESTDRFNRKLEEVFGNLVDPGLSFDNTRELFDRVSKDCFHPGKGSQSQIINAFMKHLAQENH